MADADRITANDVVAFLVELAVLVALCAWGWGWGAGSGLAAKLVLAIGTPAAAIVLWGLFAAPRSRFDVVALEVAVKVLVLGAGVLATFTLVPVGWATAFAVLVAVNTLLLYVGPLAR